MSVFALSATAASADTLPVIAAGTQVSGSAPVLFGLSLGGLVWLLAGFVAIFAGFVAATRSVRTSRSAATTTAGPSGATTLTQPVGNNHNLNGASK